ncbi:MAG: amidohydrolase [Phycisphaerae bacterium]
MKRRCAASVMVGLGVLLAGCQGPRPDRPFTGPARASRHQQAIAAKVAAIYPRLVELRRDLHMHPELSNREERTARLVADRLRALGFDEVRTGVARHGVVGLLQGGRPGRVVAVRADMDALPIQETRDVPYKSRNAGVMHACGHDVHTTVGLGVAEVLAGMKADIPGAVKFIFQPAEEGPPAGEEGGARLMVKEGALDNPRPEAIFGLHVMPTIEIGKIAYHYEAAMAAADRFVLTVRGRKVHGAYPHLGVDAVVVAAQCVTALQTIRSRRIDTLDPLVISIGSIHGGNRSNIIADEVRMEGTVRTHDGQVRERVHRMMREVVAGVCQGQGAGFELDFAEGTPATRNHRPLVEAVLPVIRAVAGDDHVISPRVQMGAEDFSYFAHEVPAFYYFLGVANPGKGITAMVHTPEFDVDERCLEIGVNVMANVVLGYLER